MNDKPKIRYSEVIVPPVKGGRAVIRLSEAHHTISQDRLAAHDNIVTTSTVKDVAGTTFETQNTIYVLAD